MKDALYGPEAIGGVLGAALGESPSEATARIEEAKKGATDLTGLIKRKKQAKGSTPEPASSTNGLSGKRKAEDNVEENGDAKKVKVVDVPANGDSKQAKVEDVVEK
jgi:HAT1-interacting factor 1